MEKVTASEENNPEQCQSTHSVHLTEKLRDSCKIASKYGRSIVSYTVAAALILGIVSACPTATAIASSPGISGGSSSGVYSAQNKTASSISFTENPSKTYDGEPVSDPSVNATSDGAVGYIYYDDSGTKLSSAPKNAGNYFVEATLAETSRYASATTGKTAFTIAKRPITVELSDSQSSGMATITAYALGMINTEGKISFSVTGPSGYMSDDVNISHDGASGFTAVTTYNYGSVSTGSYTVNASLVNSANYTCTQSANQIYDTALYTRSIIVKTNYSKTYGDDTFSLSPEVSVSGNKDEISYEIVYDYCSDPRNTLDVSSNGEVTPRHAGLSIIKINLSDGNNHYAHAVAYVTINIGRKALTVTPYATVSGSTQHVSSVTYGNLSSLSYGLDYSGFKSGDDPNTLISNQGSLKPVKLVETLPASDTGYQLAVMRIGSQMTVGSTTYDNIFFSRDYAISYGTETIKVLKAHLAITADDATGVWNTEPEYRYHFGDASGNNNLMPWDTAQDVFAELPTAVLGGSVNYSGLEPGSYAGKIKIGSWTLKSPANYDVVESVPGNLLITKAKSGIGVSAASKIFDGEPESVIKAVASGYDGTVLLKYYRVESDGTHTLLSKVPTDAGSYIVAADAPETGHFLSSTAQGNFAISAAPCGLKVTAASKTYDGTPVKASTSVVKGYDGSVSLKYYRTDKAGVTTGGTLLSGAPVNTGSYYVKASAALSKSSNYEDSDAVCAFSVSKAVPDPVSPVLPDYKMQSGNTLGNVPLPEGWTWADPTTILSAGTFSAKAVYTQDDTDNYASVERTLTFSVISVSSPKTGANSKSWLYTLLIPVSAGVLACLDVLNRKRRGKSNA